MKVKFIISLQLFLYCVPVFNQAPGNFNDLFNLLNSEQFVLLDSMAYWMNCSNTAEKGFLPENPEVYFNKYKALIQDNKKAVDFSFSDDNNTPSSYVLSINEFDSLLIILNRDPGFHGIDGLIKWETGNYYGKEVITSNIVRDKIGLIPKDDQAFNYKNKSVTLVKQQDYLAFSTYVSPVPEDIIELHKYRFNLEFFSIEFYFTRFWFWKEKDKINIRFERSLYYNPLHVAIYNGFHSKWIDAAMQVNPSLVNRIAVEESPVIDAIETNQNELAQLLTQKANAFSWVDATGKNLLFYASACNNTIMMKYLIDHGVKVNSTDSNGFTPIMLAVKNDHFKATNTLIKAGADLNNRDKSNQNVFDYSDLILRKSGLNMLLTLSRPVRWGINYICLGFGVKMPESEFEFKFKGGFYVSHKIWSTWSLRHEVFYNACFIEDMRLNEVGVDTFSILGINAAHIGLTNQEIEYNPVLRYNFPSRHSIISPFAFIGPEFIYPFSLKYTSQEEMVDLKEFETSKIHLGYTFGLGIEIIRYRHFGATFELRYNSDFNNYFIISDRVNRHLTFVMGFSF